MSAPLQYPVQLGLAYLFFIGYMTRSLFLLIRLPGAVGVIIAGIAFHYFMQPEILYARDEMQALAFFLVLLICGLEISLHDLKFQIVVVAVLPASLELCALAWYGVTFLDFSLIEAFVLGCALFCLGDGLVIPKMQEFRQRPEFSDHPLPRLMFMCAPLEACFALTVFGVLGGLADPAGQPEIQVGLLVGANILRIAATVLVGAALGSGLAWCLNRRSAVNQRMIELTGRSAFSGRSVESCLMMLGTALAAFSLGAAEEGKPFVPMSLLGCCGGPLFQSELGTIVTASVFAVSASEEVVVEVQSAVGSIWVFGQMILFGMLGSRTQLSDAAAIPSVLPMMIVGLCARFVGVLIAWALASLFAVDGCQSCKEGRRDAFFYDAVFIFLSSLPRASIQGALGSVPATLKFFQNDHQRDNVQEFIADAARIYILVLSISGSMLLDCIGPDMLTKSQEARDHRCTDCSRRDSWDQQEEELAKLWDAVETLESATPEILEMLSTDSDMDLAKKASLFVRLASQLEKYTPRERPPCNDSRHTPMHLAFEESCEAGTSSSQFSPSTMEAIGRHPTLSMSRQSSGDGEITRHKTTDSLRSRAEERKSSNRRTRRNSSGLFGSMLEGNSHHEGNQYQQVAPREPLYEGGTEPSGSGGGARSMQAQKVAPESSRDPLMPDSAALT